MTAYTHKDDNNKWKVKHPNGSSTGTFICLSSLCDLFKKFETSSYVVLTLSNETTITITIKKIIV